MRKKTILFYFLFLYLLNYSCIIYYGNLRDNGESLSLYSDRFQIQKEDENLSHRLRFNSYIELEGQIIIDGNIID